MASLSRNGVRGSWRVRNALALPVPGARQREHRRYRVRLSIGLIATALACVPMAMGLFNMNVGDNVVIQKVCCFLVASMVCAWVGV